MSSECPNCQKPIQMGAKFCGGCGAAIPQEQQRTISKGSEFFNYGRLVAARTNSVKPHQQINPRELKSLLKNIEQGRGRDFEISCQTLKEKRPIEAIEPLWKMKGKIFIKENVEKAIYEILGEIGSDKLVDLILKESYITNDNLKAMAYSVISKELPLRAVDWLGEQSSMEDTPFDILSIDILRRLGTKEAILSLAKNANAGYIDTDPGPMGKSLLLSIAIAGATAIKQDIDRKMAATLLTAPFIPIELLISAPKIVQKSQAHIFRAQVLAELVQKHGLYDLENLYNQNFKKSGSRSSNSSLESCLASAALLTGNAPPFINSAIKNVIQSRKLDYGDQISASVLTYCLIQYCKNNNSNIFYDSINAAINDKDKILNQSAIASALYLDYQPVISSVLGRITINDARFIPALAFCALYYDNPDGRNLFNQLEAKGNNEIRKASKNWREIIVEWKKL